MDDGVMTAYVHYLLVHPDYQEAGIGQTLLGKAKDYYRNYLTIVLVSYEKSRPFYEKTISNRVQASIPCILPLLMTDKTGSIPVMPEKTDGSLVPPAY